MSTTNPISEKWTACEIGYAAHRGQFRRDGKTPYTSHLEQVAERLSDNRLKAVAFLHDVLEDTDLTPTDLRNRGLAEDIVEAVVVLTKNSDIPYETYLAGVKANEMARQVKIADMLANLSDKPTEKQIVKYAKGLLFLLAV